VLADLDVAAPLVRAVLRLQHSALLERVAEANLEDDHQAASFATDPCHGLLCRRRWTKRHDSIRHRLATVLGRVSGTSATRRHCGVGRRGRWHGTPSRMRMSWMYGPSCTALPRIGSDCSTYLVL
jgi:hypothetical protein